MALNQTSVPLDLRPINVARLVSDDPPRILHPNVNQPQPLSTPNPTPISYPPLHYNPQLPPPGSAFPTNFNQGVFNWYPQGPANPYLVRCASSVNLVNECISTSNSGGELARDVSNADLSPGRRFKFLCSFGGRILPKPGSGVLRYVGGHTRLIGFKGNVDYSILARKMMETCGQAVTIKYQLPGEDLDSLVSIACQEDLDIMMEEYDKVIKSLPDGSAKLRLYLFLSSDADNSALAMLSGLSDGGQKYFEAVNGLLEEAGAVVMRKESLDSPASNPSAQVGQGNIGVLSPVGNSSGVLSQENTPKAVSKESVPLNIGIPAVASSIQISNNEIGLGRSVAPTMKQNMAFEPKQVLQTSPPYMRVCVPQLQDIKGPSVIGNPGYVLQQHQLLENTASTSPKQLLQPSSTSGSPQILLRPNAIQQMMHPSQVRQDNYPVRMLPLDPSYCAYPTQVPHSMVGGTYGWNISQPYRPVFREGPASPQRILNTNNFTRLDDCFMCQKSLPHAHSDSLAQQLKDGNESPTSDSNRSFHSLRSEVNTQTQPSNLALRTGGSGEVIDDQASGTQSRILNQADNQTAKPRSPLGVPQSMRNAPLTENSMLQQCTDISTQQYAGPSQVQAKPNALVSMPMYNEILPVVVKPSQTLEPLSRESSKETSGKYPGAIPKADSSEQSVDSHWRSNQSSEGLRICIPENILSTESGIVPDPLNHNVLDQKMQKTAGSHVRVECVNNVNVVYESNLIKPTETSSSCSSGVPYNTSQPTECYAMPFQPTTGYANERPSMVSVQKNDVPKPSYTIPSKIIDGVLQDSNPVSTNQDPLIARKDGALPSPKLNPVAVRNEADIKDPFGSSFLKNNNHVNIELWLEDAIQLPSASMVTDSPFEHGSSGQHVEQELQAVTEGLAPFSLNAAPPPTDVDLSSDGLNGLTFEVKQERGERNNCSESQDIKAKVPEKTKLGFPTSDLGHLQIINNKDLEELSELGSGTFGTVYHGKWKGTDVAIKRINDRCFQGKPSEQERMRDDFWNEAIKLADLHHPNVVAFYGVVLDGPGVSVATVTEYMVNGSLRNALQRNERSLDKRKRILIAMDVAFGMEYLHGKNIVHFDLKSDNLLVNLRDPHRPICKVGDLGLSKVKCHTLISGGVRGTLPWMAPELLNGSSSLVCEKVDVFSFGIVLWELLTGEEPYADLHYGAIIGGIVSNTLRPSVPESCDPEWRSLMEKCWSSDPSDRPTFTGIANQLRAMAGKIPPKGQK